MEVFMDAKSKKDKIEAAIKAHFSWFERLNIDYGA
jgi:hypothetical protein